MPGDPNECRANAKECLREAASARTCRDKTMFEALAQKWLRLANDYDAAQRLVTEWGPNFQNQCSTQAGDQLADGLPARPRPVFDVGKTGSRNGQANE